MLFLTLKMASEGGGKLKQKRPHTAKPYDRPKSFLNRVTDAVRGLWNHTWVAGLLTTQDSDEVSSKHQQDGGVATKRSSLNSIIGPSERTLCSANTSERRRWPKPRIPMDGEHTTHWDTEPDEDGRLTEPNEHSGLVPPLALPSTSFASGLQPLEPIAEPSTRPALGVSYRNIENSFRDEYHPLCSSQLDDSSRVGGVTASRQFSKLSNIGKLNDDDLPSASRKGELNNVNSLGGDSHSECSEESVSTSGCSSMIPHPDKHEYRGDVLSLTKPALDNLSKDLQDSLLSETRSKKDWRLSSSDAKDVSRMKQSFLWSESSISSQKAKPQPVTMGSKPHFKPHLVNCSLWEGSSVLSSTGNNSNKATYGFGSSYRRQQLALNTPYSVTPSTRSIKVKPSNNSDLEVMSATTKRILETLEKMSTPLKDAKKIPTKQADPVLDSPLSFTYANCRRRPSYAKRSISVTERIKISQSSSNHGPPVTRLMTPGSVAVTKTYLKFAGEIPNSPSLVLSKEVPTTNAPNSNTAPRAGGKMKSLKDGLHYSRKVDDDHEIVEPVNLPSVPLPIKQLPVFNIVPSNSLKSSPAVIEPKSNIVAAPEKRLTDTVKSILKSSSEQSSLNTYTSRQSSSNYNHATTATESCFSFSSPIVQQAFPSQVAVIPKAPKEVTHFEFSSPIAVGGNEKTSSSTNELFKTPMPSTQLRKKLPVIDADPEIENQPGELKSGSVLDVLKKSNTSGFGDKFKPPSANWECPLCMISNKPDVSKCIACETVKPNDKAEAFNRTASSAPNTVPSFSSNGFGEKFKLSAGTWECPTCLLHVSQNLQKCMACETAKPGSASTATDVKSSTHTGTDVKSISPNVNVSSGISASKINFNFSSSSTFHDKFKTTPSTWECEICLVENTSKDNKCKSCDSPKPIISLPVTTSGFKFGFTTQTTSSVSTVFTTQSSANIPTDVTQNKKMLPTSTVSSEIQFGVINNNSTSSTPVVTGFKFGVPDKDSKSDSAPPSSGFKFAIPSVPGFETVASAEKSKQVASCNSKLNSNTVSSVEVVHPVEKDVLTVSSRREDNGSTANTSVEAVKDPKVDSVKIAANELTSASIEKVEFPATLPFATPLPSVATTSTTSSFTFASNIGNPTFSFGTTPTTTISTVAVVTSEPTTVSNSQTQKEGFAFKFGNAEAPKSNAPTVTTAVQPCFGFPASDISAGSTAQHTAAQDGGGFKFTFGKNKRNADDDNVDNSKKCAMPSAGDTPVAFGSFSAGGNPVVSAAGGVSVGFSSSSPFTAVSTTATATPIFGALSTAASKPTVSSTFSFGNSGNVTSLNATPLPTFGGASQAQATSSSIFGSPFAQPNTPQNPSALAFGASSSSTTTSFGGPANSSLLAFGSQNADAGVTNNTSVPPAFGTSNPARVSPFAPASTNSVFGITPPTFGGFGSLQSGAINPSPAPSLPGPNFTGGFNLSTPPTFQFGRQPQADNGVFTFSGNQNSSAPLPAFSFGQSNSSQTTAGYNFNPSPQPPEFSSNPFDAQGNVNRTARPIKRAKRRTQPHNK